MDYARIAVFELKGTKEEALKLAREGLLPVFRASPGFISYDMMMTDDGKSFISITRWRTKEGAERAGRNAADFDRAPEAKRVVSLVSNFVGVVEPMGTAATQTESRASAPSFPS